METHCTLIEIIVGAVIIALQLLILYLYFKRLPKRKKKEIRGNFKFSEDRKKVFFTPELDGKYISGCDPFEQK
jgi:hypothetical protein